MTCFRLAATLAAAALIALVALACGGDSEATSRSSVNAGRPCGTAKRPPARYRHVVWIVMENKGYGDVIGNADSPYITALGKACGVASRFFAETHPSAPNYIAMTSGGTQGLTDDGDPFERPIDAPSIFSQLGSGGWRALLEAMPSNCRTKYLLPEYYARHNAAAYYTNIRAACKRYDVPLRRTPDLSARFTYIAPNSCHSMHTCDTATGDAWLRQFMPKVLKSAQYRSGGTAVFLTWDESDDKANRIPTLVIAPSVKPRTIVGARFDHYSLLRTTEQLLGLKKFLGKAATAPSMRPAFRF